MNQAKEGNKCEQLTRLYWHVCSCWNNYDLAKREGMSVERAISLLRKIAHEGTRFPALHKRAVKLLDAIVKHAAEPVAMQKS